MAGSGSDSRADSEPPRYPAVHSEMSGSAADVVQARDVSGGVHFYRTRHAPGPVPRQLPGDVRGFVDRVTEAELLDRALEHEDSDRNATTILLITGTAGVGKTSLAVHWAHRVREQYSDGHLYINLRGYDPGAPVTPEYALDEFLRALGVPDRAVPVDVPAKSALFRSMIADRRMLIVLDNAATVGQVRPLLPGAAGCLAVVTSRSRLPGLVARDGAYRVTVDTLVETEAVDLLRGVTAGYRANDSSADLAELARLCARLPLALRVAAERAAARPQMPLGELIRNLRDESALWDALSAEGDGDTDGVRTVFAWSYRALSEDAARLFRLLGLHPGPEFGISAAAATAGTTAVKVRHLLDSLVGVHLLEQTTHDRYRFHDLLHAYAIDQAHNDESLYNQHATLQRVLGWYLYTANAAADALGYNPQPISLGPPVADVEPLSFTGRADALHWCESERSNLVDAVRAAVRVRLDGIAWRLHAVLREYYAYRCHFGDWFETANLALEAVRRQRDRYGEAIVLESLGKAYRQTNRLGEAEEHHNAALAIRRELGDRSGEARSLNAIGLACRRRGALDDAKSRFEQAVTLAEEIDHDHWRTVALANLGETHVQRGDLVQAEETLHRALTMARQQDNRHFQFECLRSLGRARRESQPIEAVGLVRQALAISRDLEDASLEGIALIDYAAAQLATGQVADALVSYQRAATIHRQFGDHWREAAALSGAGEAYRQLDRLEESTRFHRRAVAALRGPDERRGLALALGCFAATLYQAGNADEARECWREVLAVMSGFTDPNARLIRVRANQCLDDPSLDVDATVAMFDP